MNSAGPPDNTTPVEEDSGCGYLWLVLPFAGLLIVLAIIAGREVASVSYAVIYPDMPPLPQSAIQELAYEQTAHGADSWFYAVDMPACDIVAFYREVGECPPPSLCAVGSSTEIIPGSIVGRCQGIHTFNAFGLLWQAEISAGTTTVDTAFIRISREVLWTGVPSP